MNAILRKAIAYDAVITRQTFASDAKGRPLLLWWPDSTTASPSARTFGVTIQAAQGELRGQANQFHGLVDVVADTQAFLILEKDIPSAAPVAEDVQFYAGHTLATRKKWKVIRHTVQLGLVNIEAQRV